MQDQILGRMPSLLAVVTFLFAIQRTNIGVAADIASDTNQRALALLRGVENSRKSVGSGELEMTVSFKNATGTKTSDLRVLFDGGRRRLDATKSEPRATKTVITEKDLIHFDGDDSCTLQEPRNAISAYSFDPRCLGIMASYLLEDSIERCLGYRDSKSITYIGQEDINGHNTSHVQVVDAYGQHVDFWIEEVSGFPVHKYQFRTPAGSYRAEAISRYDPTSAPFPIPVEIESKGFNRSGQLIEQRNVRVRSASLGNENEIDYNEFELVGLDLPIGTPVSDLRLKERLGYWNGRGLSIDKPDDQWTGEYPWGIWPFIGVTGVIIVIIGVIMSRRMARAASR